MMAPYLNMNNFVELLALGGLNLDLEPTTRIGLDTTLTAIPVGLVVSFPAFHFCGP